MNHTKSRFLRITLILCIILALTAVTALAYLSTATEKPLENIFKPAPEQNPVINESFDNTVKSNVTVNVGNPGYAVYVRAVIVVNWEKDGENGQLDTNIFHATTPVAGTDYTITLNTAAIDPWFYNDADGFYYHKAMVAYDGTDKETAILITECKLKDGITPPDGYHLNVQIVAQTIQALGTTDADGTVYAVEDAWKTVEVDSNGNLVSKPTS